MAERDAAEIDAGGRADGEGPSFPWLRGRGMIVAAVIFAIIMAGRLSPIEPVREVFHSFGWLTEQALRITRDLFESYGYLTVFLAPMLENTLFIGALIPGTLVMLLAGLSAHEGFILFWPAVLLGAVGAMIGDTISYGIGRFGWQRFGPDSRLGRMAEGMREPLLHNSVWLILSYHFAGYSRLIGPAASGFLRVPFLRWMMLDYLGVTIWVITFMTAGYLLGVFGLSLDDSDRNVRVFELILFAFFIIAIVTVARSARSQRRRTATTDGDAPDEPGDVAATGSADATPEKERERA